MRAFRRNNNPNGARPPLRRPRVEANPINHANNENDVLDEVLFKYGMPLSSTIIEETAATQIPQRELQQLAQHISNEGKRIQIETLEMYENTRMDFKSLARSTKTYEIFFNDDLGVSEVTTSQHQLAWAIVLTQCSIFEKRNMFLSDLKELEYPNPRLGMMYIREGFNGFNKNRHMEIQDGLDKLFVHSNDSNEQVLKILLKFKELILKLEELGHGYSDEHIQEMMENLFTGVSTNISCATIYHSLYMQYKLDYSMIIDQFQCKILELQRLANKRKHVNGDSLIASVMSTSQANVSTDNHFHQGRGGRNGRGGRHGRGGGRNGQGRGRGGRERARIDISTANGNANQYQSNTNQIVYQQPHNVDYYQPRNNNFTYQHNQQAVNQPQHQSPAVQNGRNNGRNNGYGRGGGRQYGNAVTSSNYNGRYSTNLPDLCDSGASSIHIKSEERFNNMEDTPTFMITMADSHSIRSSGKCGTVGPIPACNFSPDFAHNLVGINKLCTYGYYCVFDEEHVLIIDSELDTICGIGEVRNSLYYMNLDKLNPSQRILNHINAEAEESLKQPEEILMSKDQYDIWYESACVADNHSVNRYEKWHSRLHLPKSTMANIIRADTSLGLDLTLNDIKEQHHSCISCMQSVMDKPSRLYQYPNGHPIDVIGGQLNTDICGPLHIKGIGNQSYILGFTDVFSKYRFIYLLKTKDEATKYLEVLVTELKTRGYQVHRIHSDQGGEYTGEGEDMFRPTCDKLGILWSTTPRYTPKANRSMERYWRTLMNAVRVRLADSKSPNYLWPYAAKYSTIVYNYTKIISIDGESRSAHEIFTGNKPDLSKLKRWGSVASSWIDKSLRRKLDAKAELGYFMGIDEQSSSTYVYIPATRTVITTGDVIVDETRVDLSDESLVIRSDQMEESEELTQDTDFTRELNQILTNAGVNQSNIIQQSTSPAETVNDEGIVVPITTTRPTRIRQPNTRVFNDEYATTATEDMKVPILEEDELDGTDIDTDSFYECVRLSTELLQEQTNKAIDISIHDAKKNVNWQKAMEIELHAIEQNETWYPEYMPNENKSFSTRWVFAEKVDESNGTIIYKGRLTIRGFTAQFGIDYDDIYSPVVKLTSLRMLFAIAALLNLQLNQMDVVTAFLNAKFEDDDPPVYIDIPEGYAQRFGELCTEHNLQQNKSIKLRLKRALYGLKQSPRAWNKELNSFIVQLGFRRMSTDSCLYIKTSGAKMIIVPVYVDDFVIAYNDKEFFDQFRSAVMDKYKVKDMGQLNVILGMKVTINDEGISIDNKKYLQNTLVKFHMSASKENNIPIEASDIRLLALLQSPTITEQSNTMFRSIIGSILYACICTRIELGYAISILSRYLGKASKEHVIVAMKLLRYIHATIDKCITYKRNSFNTNPITFCDADYNKDIEKGMSILAFVIYLAGAPISWKTKYQKSPPQSTSESEYVTLSNAIKELLWILYVITELDIPGYMIQTPLLVFEDNTGAIHEATTVAVSQKMKHIRPIYHFIKKEIQNEIIAVIHMQTEGQIIDINTKPNCSNTHKKLSERLFNLHNIDNIRYMKNAIELHNIKRIKQINNINV